MAKKATTKAKKASQAVEVQVSNREYIAQLATQYGWQRQVIDNDYDVYHFAGTRPIQVPDVNIAWTQSLDPSGQDRMVMLDGRRDMAMNDRNSIAHAFGDQFSDPGGVNRFGLQYLVQHGIRLVGQYAGLDGNTAWQKWLTSDEYLASQQ